MNLLPRPKDVNSAAVETSLKKPLEEAHGAELLVCLTGGGAHGQAGPYDQCQG
jgi:hypothetical protein